MKLFSFVCLATDANRARRLRRHQANSASNSQTNSLGSQTEARQQPIGNPQLLNAQGQLGQQQAGLGVNQAGRQYYPNQGQYQQGQYQQGMMPGSNMQYGSYGSGYQSGYNQCEFEVPRPTETIIFALSDPSYNQYGSGSQYGQGMGSSGAYYNQNPGYSSFYGSNSGSYNRPSYSQYGSGYGSGSGYGFWNAGQKQNVNLFTVLFSSFVALSLCLLTM